MNKNITIGIVVALIVGGVVGYASAAYQYSAILNKAKAAFPTQTATTFVSGTIQSISGNTITLQTSPSANPFVTTPTTREVTVTSTTKIVKNEPVDPAVYQEEMTAYQKAMQKVATSTTMTTPPTPVTQTTLALSDLKAGDMILVDAGKDVSTATSFDAVTITVSGTGIVVPVGTAAGTAPMVNTPTAGSANGSAPIVNTPPPLNPNGAAVIVNTPPPVKK